MSQHLYFAIIHKLEYIFQSQTISASTQHSTIVMAQWCATNDFLYLHVNAVQPMLIANVNNNPLCSIDTHCIPKASVGYFLQLSMDIYLLMSQTFDKILSKVIVIQNEFDLLWCSMLHSCLCVLLWITSELSAMKCGAPFGLCHFRLYLLRVSDE